MTRRLALVIVMSFLMSHSLPAAAAGPADHVVISEIRVGDAPPNSNDEFVELYNPTDSPIVMTNWKLAKKSSSGNQYNLASSFSGTIEAHGYFLITPKSGDGYSEVVAPDARYTQSSNFLASDNSLLLYNNGTGTVVDKAGWGSANDYETDPISDNPVDGGSIERKAFGSSTFSDMNASGSHAKLGNSYDSDNNADDFVLQNTSDPQNISSAIERCCTTVEGTITLQGRDTYSGISLLMWPGEGLQAGTDDAGTFSIANVPAVAGADTYTVEVTVDSYLLPRNSLDLTDETDANGVLLESVTLPAIRLLGGDINKDNRVNIQDLARIGSKFDRSGSFAEDINGDGQVNIQDLAIAAGNFGQDTSVYGSWPEE